MKNLFLSLVFMIIPMAGFCQTNPSDTLLFELNFESKFEEDKLKRFEIGESSYELNIPLTTNKIIGFTGCSISGYSNGVITFSSRAFKDTVVCKELLEIESHLKISVKINHRKIRRRLDLREGKYIGFGRRVTFGYYLYQSPRFILYD